MLDAPDFFISYTGKDRAWAEWIAWTLEEAGYHTLIQARDFQTASNLVLKMQQGATDATRTIAVLTPDYFRSAFTNAEWAVAFASDPASQAGKLIAVRVADFAPPGLFSTIVYIDLVGLDESSAQQRLTCSIGGIVKGARGNPELPPAFPGTAPPKPAFPAGAEAPRAATASVLQLSPPVADFTGRRAELRKLRSRVRQGRVAITRVRGMGGVGKTELARRLAAELKTDYPDAQIEIDLRGVSPNPLSPAQILTSLIHVFSPTAKLPEETGALRGVLNQCINGKKVLLLLDNARDAAQLKPLLPLALRLAASLLASRPDLGAREYLEELSQSRDRLQAIDRGASSRRRTRA